MPQHIAQNPFVIHPPQDLTILKRQSDALSRKYVDGERPVTEQDLQAMGRALWNALDIQTEFDAAREAAGAAILPVVIESDRADAQGLPWEMLYHPVHGFIGRHSGFTLTRRIKTAPPSAPPLDKGPLRVLLFTSLPSDVNAERGRLDIEEEQAQVQEALLPWIGKGLVKLDMPNDGRFSTFAEMVKKFAPHVLFLSGHGRFYHQPHMGEPPHGEFQFEGEVDGSNLVKEDKIAEALVGTGAQLVILSACESGKAASDALNNGLMRRISAQGIPHVIGMRESVLDVAGTFFVRALCDALGGRERVDAAAQAARAAIFNLFDEASEAAKLLSSAQWPLPILISSAPHSPLIDWEFAPQAVEPRVFNRALSTVSLPPRFVGRRAELRRWQNDVLSGKTRALLITGPGGQGKTALAGELALSLQKRGWRVFAWRAQLGSAWRSFEFEMEMALEKAHAERYDRAKGGLNSDGERARWLFGLLAEQFNGQVALFLDNLETLQDPSTLHLRDPQVKAWMEAAQVAPELTLLVTSRWKIPNWNGEHLPLDHASYGDFLQMARLLAQNGQMPASLLQDRDKMHRVYDALGGNSRGLGFFAAAAQGMMTAADEEEFMQAVAKAQEDEKADMAIEVIYKHLPAYAQTLLHRLPAFAEPVPVEGLIKLGLDLPNPQELVSRLLDVSLLGAQEEPSWDAVQYACAALVRDWLSQNKLVDENPAWLNSVAEYHVYLLSNERPTVGQAMTAIQALRRAGRTAQADRLTLDVIIGPLTNAGLYRTLLGEWLPPILNSPDKQTRGQALGQGGKLLLHLGDFKQALPVLQESLAIQQEIGDKAGEGATLNNISTLYHAQGEYATALEYLKKSLAIMQEIGDKKGEGTTLNNISQIYDAQGDYATALEYMKKSLAIMQEIGDKKGEGTTLNNISQIYAAQGEYATALEYLKKSLAIRQEIGDKAGLCATLFNMGHIYAQNNEMQEATGTWVITYLIAKQINSAQALQALANLAPQLGLPAGLGGWEQLAEQMQAQGGRQV